MRWPVDRSEIRLPRRLCYGALNAGEDTMWCACADDPSRCEYVGRTMDGECIVFRRPRTRRGVGRVVLKLLRRSWRPLAKLALAGPKPVVSGASVCLQRLRCRLWPRSARQGLSRYTGDWRGWVAPAFTRLRARWGKSRRGCVDLQDARTVAIVCLHHYRALASPALASCGYNGQRSGD
jgi:hypothetical protein